jgi:pimeloyl-ACP methyl ester carboxylesterase
MGLAPALGPYRRADFPVRLDDVRSDRKGAWRYPATVDRLIRGLALPERAPSLRVPFLALHGAHDRIVPLADAEALARRAPRARLVRIDGATHFTTPLEPRAIAAVTAFLKEPAA